MTEQQLYPVTCAWCGQVVGYATVSQSHSICKDCAKTLGVDLPQAREDTPPSNDHKENR